jgi:signal transduction histidine kinase
VAAWERVGRLPLGAEIALALAAGAGTFALVAVALAGIDSGVAAALLGVVFLVAVISIARFVSIAYAVPVGMAGMLAFDWFYLPPTHPLEFPDSPNLADLVIYLAVAVLLGVLAAHAAGRAAAAERARGEIADEQAALRRMATLVARGAAAGELFAAVAAEAGDLLDVDGIRIARYEDETELVHVAEWSKPGDARPAAYDRAKLEGTSVSAEVLGTGRAARIDNYQDIPVRASFARDGDVKSVVGAPVVVEGRVWGVMIAWSVSGPLPSDTERRLTDFAELVATAISNTDARTGLARLADEQAALRSVATLVARGAAPAETLGFVAAEIGRLFGAEVAVVFRYEPDRTGTVVGRWSVPGVTFPDGARLRVVGVGAAAMVLETGRPVRTERFEGPEGSIANCFAQLGARSGVGAPITVEGRLWGAVVAATTRPEGLPDGSEGHIAGFTELVATAISNAQAREDLRRLADEQAALRRVATLVAKESSPGEVFAKVAEEAASVFEDVACVLLRDEGDGTATVVAVRGEGVAAGFPVGRALPVGGDGLIAFLLREGLPRRIDDYSAAPAIIVQGAREHGIGSAVGCPIVVGGRRWGAMVVARSDAEPLPPKTETRIAQFADLVATAIANTEARAEVERLAEEQAALRRVATLVAEGASPAAVFDAVAAEMKSLLAADHLVVCRYEPGAELTVLAHRGSSAQKIPPGARISHEGDSVEATVRHAERSARMESYEGAHGVIAENARAAGVRVAVGAPIVVDGRLWGVVSAGWNWEQSPPANTEQRMAQFAQLLDTATANADSRAELIASRARLVAASDQARRRFERDLHDGVQQRLVSLALELHGAEATAPREDTALVTQLAHVRQGLTGALDELRELSRGIHPAILSEGGLVPALRALARRSAVPVELHLSVDERLADHVEVGAYYVVSEALTNAAKHARASKVEVNAHVHEGRLRLTIDDDGVGGADPARGSGLIGLADRIAALGGTIAITSPPGKGTSLRVELSVGGQ